MLNQSGFLNSLAENHFQHQRGSNWFTETESKISNEVAGVHGLGISGELEIGELGTLFFPFFEMGSVNSKALFGLDELILFAFYYANRKRYRTTLDLGANIGLHTLVMKKLGFSVTSYEPDLTHLNQIHLVLNLNNMNTEHVVPKAISDSAGTMKYIRVLGNTTNSHLLGAKENVYGPTDIVSVEVYDILEILNQGNFDLVKMDVEGHEAVLLNRVTVESLKKTDIILEIGSEKNASKIYEIFKQKGIPAYAQKIGWGLVENLKRSSKSSHSWKPISLNAGCS
jgi:FkbM family methyltransferase